MRRFLVAVVGVLIVSGFCGLAPPKSSRDAKFDRILKEIQKSVLAYQPKRVPKTLPPSALGMKVTMVQFIARLRELQLEPLHRLDRTFGGVDAKDQPLVDELIEIASVYPEITFADRTRGLEIARDLWKRQVRTPVTALCAGLVFQREHSEWDSLACLEMFVKRTSDRKDVEPALRALGLSVLGLAELRWKRGESAGKRWGPAAELWYEAAKGWSNAALNQRVLEYLIEGTFFEGASAEGLRKLADLVAADSKLDRWFTQMIAGCAAEQVAWRARGNGFAASVSKEAYAEFDRGIAAARKAFTTAEKADPARPEAATGMIRIVMCESRRTEDEATWFEKAITAQRDWAPAYRAFGYALRPKWGGKLELMLAFTNLCAEQGRSDSVVPELALWTLIGLCSDYDDTPLPLVLPGAYDSAKTAVRRLLAQNKDAGYARRLNSLLLLFAWVNDDAAEARRLLRALDGRVEVRELPLPIPPKLIRETVTIASTPALCELIESAVKSYLAGNPGTASRGARA